MTIENIKLFAPYILSYKKNNNITSISYYDYRDNRYLFATYIQSYNKNHNITGISYYDYR